MIFIEYDPRLYSAACPDGRALDDAEGIAETARQNVDWDYHLTYSTDNIFYALRMLIVNGTLPHDKILFVYQGHAYGLDEYGHVLGGWPEGFADLAARFNEAIIKAIMQKEQSDGRS